MDYKDEFFEDPLEKYKTGDWMKKIYEKIDREKKKAQKENKMVDRVIERRMRREERIERAMAACYDILLVHEKEKEKESEKKEDLIEIGIENNDVILDSCYNPNIFLSCDNFIIKKVADDFSEEEVCKKLDEEVLPMEQYNATTELQEKNIGKPWPTIILVPSSKLNCEVKCWVSSNSIHLPNFSSLCCEKYNVTEGDCLLQMDSIHELDKEYYAFESKGNVGQKNLSNDLAYLMNVKVSYGDFIILTFDPGGNTAINSRANSLGEGGNDENLQWACCQILITLVLF